jgi:hypothetical protein
MSPATFHPDLHDAVGREKLTPASHSYLEPRGEGLLFAFLCLLASAIIYSGVLLVRFLT